MNRAHTVSRSETNMKPLVSLLNPLADKSKPWAIARFSHKGETLIFYSCVNKMSGHRLSAFGNEAPGIDDPLPWVKSVLGNILAHDSTAELAGTIKPEKPKSNEH